jgi:hypothetical protein
MVGSRRNRRKRAGAPNTRKTNQGQECPDPKKAANSRVSSAPTGQADISCDQQTCGGAREASGKDEQDGKRRKHLMRSLTRFVKDAFPSVNHTIAWATITYTIATIVYVVVSIYQYGATLESINLVQRPFITIYPDAAQKIPSGEQSAATSYAFMVHIENTGATPTKNLKVNYFAGWNLATNSSSKLPSFEKKVLSRPGISYSLGPKVTMALQSMPFAFNTPPTKDDFDGEKFFNFWIIQYDDIFKRTPHHTTELCVFVERSVFNPDTVELQFCDKGNCVDDECKVSGFAGK